MTTTVGDFSRNGFTNGVITGSALTALAVSPVVTTVTIDAVRAGTLTAARAGRGALATAAVIGGAGLAIGGAGAAIGAIFGAAHDVIEPRTERGLRLTSITAGAVTGAAAGAAIGAMLPPSLTFEKRAVFAAVTGLLGGVVGGTQGMLHEPKPVTNTP